MLNVKGFDELALNFHFSLGVGLLAVGDCYFVLELCNAMYLYLYLFILGCTFLLLINHYLINQS
jgi:hypothetical protein